MQSNILTINGVDYTNTLGITITNSRPENNISALEFTISDKNVSDIVEKEDIVSLQLKNKKQSYTTTFTGRVYALQSDLAPQTITCFCKGYMEALESTHCDTSFGVESLNPTKDTPREIIQELCDNYVENSFGDAETTNWKINSSDTYVENVHSALSATNLTSKYLNNITVLNRLLEIVNAYAITLGAPEPGIHWFERPDADNPRLMLKEIGDDHSNGDWPKYYGGSQAAATVKQGIDILSYSFHQTAEPFANNVVLACNLRKPASDYWTEAAAANAIWTVVGDGAVSDDAVNYVIGADATKLTNDATRLVWYYFDLNNNINLNYLGTQDSIPTISFYARRTSNSPQRMWLVLYTNRAALGGAGDQFYIILHDETVGGGTTFLPSASQWHGISIPIGTYYQNFSGFAGTAQHTWKIENNADWKNIDGIMFGYDNLGYAGQNDFWLDDLHINGKIIREARDAGAITGGEQEKQVFLRLDTAIDDSCTTTDNTGTAARLVASELFKRSQFKTTAANRHLTGTLVMPMKEDLLPGQQLYVNCGKRLNGTYKYQLDMRCKKVVHKVSVQGYSTEATVTSDLWNSHTFDTPSAWGILKASAGALGHAEARDLKASGVELNIPRLTWDPTA